MADYGDMPLVDVFAVTDELHGRAKVVGIVGHRRRLDPAAALADAALVVAEDGEPRVGERTRQLAENRNAEDGFVSVGWPRSGYENDARQWTVRGVSGLRERAGKRKTVCGNPDLLVVGP